MEHIAYVAALKAYRVGLARLGFSGPEQISEEKMAEYLAMCALNEVLHEDRK